MSRIRHSVIAAAVSMLAMGAHTASAKDKLTVAFIPGIASDPFFLAMEKGARAAAEKLGVELIWQGSASEYSPQSQLPFVDAALANDIDALILVPTDPDSLQPSVTRAEAAGIPVITVAYHGHRPGLPDVPYHRRQCRRRPAGGQDACRTDWRRRQGLHHVRLAGRNDKFTA